MYYVPYRGVGIIFGSLSQEATNYGNDSHPFNLTDNDKTERVEETNHTETMHSGADRPSFMSNGYSSTSIN